MGRFEFTHVVHALLQNALDEAVRGHCRVIDVELASNAVRVSDDGRGLPIHPHPRSGRPLVEVILTGARRGPKNTLARVNAHCLWLEVEIHRDGTLWFQRYEFARSLAEPQRRGSATHRGTTFTCAPVSGSGSAAARSCH